MNSATSFSLSGHTASMISLRASIARFSGVPGKSKGMLYSPSMKVRTWHSRGWALGV